MKKLCDRDTGLEVVIVGGKLHISIGVDALAWAAEHSPDFEDEWFEPTIKITNPDKFAGDVVRELEKEQEDGTTQLHLLLDTAFRDAVDNGSEHCILQGEQ